MKIVKTRLKLSCMSLLAYLFKPDAFGRGIARSRKPSMYIITANMEARPKSHP
jgi:hypothetical protein